MRDKIRVFIWKETIILLNNYTNYVFLSVTIPNAFKTVEQANANNTIANDGHRHMSNKNNNFVNLIGGIINNAFNNNNNNNNNGFINSQVNIVNASSNPNAGINLTNNFNGENSKCF